MRIELASSKVNWLILLFLLFYGCESNFLFYSNLLDWNICTASSHKLLPTVNIFCYQLIIFHRTLFINCSYITLIFPLLSSYSSSSSSLILLSSLLLISFFIIPSSSPCPFPTTPLLFSSILLILFCSILSFLLSYTQYGSQFKQNESHSRCISQNSMFTW